MLQLILSTDWVSCSEEIMALIARDTASGRPGRILMVPELISHDRERRLCAAAGDSASRYAEVLSFTRLARRVAEHCGCASEGCMDSGGRIVAMAAATRQLHSRLKAYASLETKPEFLAELVNTVDEFKRCRITSADLQAAAAQTEGSLAQKLEELSLILEAYDSLCTRGHRDPRDQMNLLLDQLEDSCFARHHVFYIDGFPDFTRQHMAILEHLILHSPSVTVALNCDSIGSGLLAFEKAGDTASQLWRFAKNAGVEIRVRVLPPKDPAMNSLCTALFQGKLPEPESLSGRVRAVCAESAYEEVLLAAEHIMDLVRSGCRYRDISLVCTDMAVYKSLIHLVFHRWGIPVYLSGTEEILDKTVISTVLAAMDAALGGFEQRPVLRYLKSGLSPLDPDTRDKVENYAITWGIRGKKWRENWTFHPDGLGGIWNDEADRALALLNEARAQALEPLFALEREVRAAGNLAGQVRALYDFLERIALADRLSAMADEMDREGDNRSAQILNQLWEILLTALEQLHDVLGQTIWDPDTFTRLFTLLLSQYDVGTIPPVLDGVTAGPVSAMRCQSQPHLIVLGAVEGLLPGYGGSSGVLTDQERVTLRNLGVTLTGGALEGLQAEFAEVYGVFAGASQSIWISYPSGQPSYVLRRLALVAGGEEKGIPGPGAALWEPGEAAHYLARWSDAAAPGELKLERSWADARRRCRYTLGNISPENIRKLYGTSLRLSASQIDRQAECRMSYFLKYGIRAKERKEATVDSAEFGTFVHEVLERTAREVMNRGGFHTVSLEDTLDLARTYALEYQEEYFRDLDSQRLSYLFLRNHRELEMVVTELWKELKDAQFEPRDFETAFGPDGKFPAISIPGGAMPAYLRGFVDRVDLWEHNGRHYFRVVDYKTGKKDFDYCDIFNGVGLQMLLYLFALRQSGSALTGDPAFPAGVQYFPARAGMVTADGSLTEEEAEAARQKEWKRRGLLLQDEEVLLAMEPLDGPGRMPYTRKKDGSISGDLADRDQLKLLEAYVFRVLQGMVDDIASGNVTPNPYTRGTSHDACAYCPYASVCHKQSVTGRRNYKTMTSQRFWEDVEKEVREHG